MSMHTDRRRYPRFLTEPMYTPMSIRLLDDQEFTLEGHAYDISEGGVRFEMDRGIEPGTRVAMQITLPTMNHHDIGPGRSVFVFANVIWITDEDELGPVRMAAVFSQFARAGDKDRLLKQFATGRYLAAA